MIVNKTNILQNLQVYNWRSLRIKNAKSSGLYSYMNTNIKEDFQICASAPLVLIPQSAISHFTTLICGKNSS